jgi:membrane protein involved in colicin uptake
MAKATKTPEQKAAELAAKEAAKAAKLAEKEADKAAKLAAKEAAKAAKAATTQTLYDCKSREVHVKSFGDKIEISKPSTGQTETFDKTDDVDILDYIEFLVGDSQN